MEKGSQGPWREVVHIKTIERRDRYGYLCTRWFLTLECGHFKTVSRGRFIPARDIMKPVRFAPKKVRCLICEPETRGLD